MVTPLVQIDTTHTTLQTQQSIALQAFNGECENCLGLITSLQPPETPPNTSKYYKLLCVRRFSSITTLCGETHKHNVPPHWPMMPYLLCKTCPQMPISALSKLPIDNRKMHQCCQADPGKLLSFMPAGEVSLLVKFTFLLMNLQFL